jgi:superfamily I DNA and/or RNA helicase
MKIKKKKKTRSEVNKQLSQIEIDYLENDINAVNEAKKAVVDMGKWKEDYKVSEETFANANKPKPIFETITETMAKLSDNLSTMCNGGALERLSEALEGSRRPSNEFFDKMSEKLEEGLLEDNKADIGGADNEERND